MALLSYDVYKEIALHLHRNTLCSNFHNGLLLFRVPHAKIIDENGTFIVCAIC